MAKKKAKVKDTDIIVVLDRSGSMASIGEATVSGFNSFVKEQKAAEGDAFLTLVQFDNQYEVNYKEKHVKKVEDLVYGETFVPRATTALHDAIGRTINETKTENDVVFVIITDGFENSSREFDGKAINKLIEEKKKSGWNFLFLGANQDAIKTGTDLGISASNSMTFNTNSSSVNAFYSNVSGKLSSYRSAKSKIFDNPDLIAATLNFTQEDREDVNK
jgi:hypothetical protein